VELFDAFFLNSKCVHVCYFESGGATTAETRRYAIFDVNSVYRHRHMMLFILSYYLVITTYTLVCMLSIACISTSVGLGLVLEACVEYYQLVTEEKRNTVRIL